MARPAALSTVSTNTKKRKSTGSTSNESNKNAKRPRNTLDAFFSPRIPAPDASNDKNSAKETVTLNDEQRRVLRMVVEEEKSVFFTGAAGEYESVLFRRTASVAHATKALVSD